MAYAADFGAIGMYDDLAPEAGMLDDLDGPRAFQRQSPLDVDFNVCLPQPAAAGETVFLSGTAPELAAGVQMQPCDTGGGRRLWKCIVRLDPSTMQVVQQGGGQALAPMSLLQAQPLTTTSFSVRYQLKNAQGIVLQECKQLQTEIGSVRPCYYHRALFPGAEKTFDEAFPLFVHEEIHQLQLNRNQTAHDFHARFVQLAQAGPFTQRRELMDKELVDLITNHWRGVEPPPQTVIAIAIGLGAFRKQAALPPKTESAAGGRHGRSEKSTESEEDRVRRYVFQSPVAGELCNWIVQYCPRVKDFADEDRVWREQHPTELSAPTATLKYAMMGVQLVAETLYLCDKSFEWLLPLSPFLEGYMPEPISVEQLVGNEQFESELIASFDQSIAMTLLDLREAFEAAGAAAAAAAPPAGGAKEIRGPAVSKMMGLCSYCPGVNALKNIVLDVRKQVPQFSAQLRPMIFARIRTLRFGKADKASLMKWIEEGGMMNTDDLAIALLKHTYYPDIKGEFSPMQIMDMVQAAMVEREGAPATRDGVRAAGIQVCKAMREWLHRLYGRTIEPKPLTVGAAAAAEMAGGPAGAASALPRGYRKHHHHLAAGLRGAAGDLLGGALNQILKADVIPPMKAAIEGWNYVLSRRCFSQSPEAMRELLDELSRLSVFRDPEGITVLDSLCDLEEVIAQVETDRMKEELLRIAVKAARDAQDTSESEDSEGLLNTLFKQPTPLRFHVITEYIGWRHASNNLDRILSNRPIWSRLLQHNWREARRLEKTTLGNIQRSGITMLTESATRVANSTIDLSTLTTILNFRPQYEELVGLAAPEKRPRNLDERAATLTQFKEERQFLQNYAKLYCVEISAETRVLDDRLEDIRAHFQTMQLQVAAAKFDGLLVRPHLPWIYSLHSSDVFHVIWKSVASDYREQHPGNETFTQETVVKEIIPEAKRRWEELAASIENGTAVLRNIEWVQKSEWTRVEKEFELLESTAPKASAWVQKAYDMAKAMRLAAKLKEWAPAVLKLREVLAELFRTAGTDATVSELTEVVRKLEKLWDMTLGQMQGLVSPHKATINKVGEEMQNYIILAASHEESLTLLMKHKSLEDFNRLISICRPNTDNPMILEAIASFQAMRTFLADVLFEKPPYSGVANFLNELANLEVDNDHTKALTKVHKQFAPMNELINTNSRSPGVQAFHDLKTISQNGVFYVYCSNKENEQIMWGMPDSEGNLNKEGRIFTYESLQELRRTLLMSELPEEMEGTEDLPRMLGDLVEMLQILEEYGQTTKELLMLGHFSYEAGQQVLKAEVGSSSEAFKGKLAELKQKLEGWEAAVRSARNTHYFLNYFTLQELCFLAKSAPTVGADQQQWERVWALLRVLNQNSDGDAIKKQVVSWITSGRLPQNTAGEEDKLLNAMGAMVGEIFGGMAPLERKLDSWNSGNQQQWQSDLLIKNLSQEETSTPVFVCTSDTPAKVTELILSIYVRRDRVPEAEELLLCSQSTTQEEIELLLRRFFTARDYQREDRLYCLGNVHLLPYVVQVGTVETLRSLQARFGYSRASVLVFVSGQRNQMLTNALIRHNITVGTLPAEALTNAIKEVGSKYHGKEMKVVAAQMNGVGKTHYILRQVWDMQQQNNNRPVLHHVDIRETTTMASLVATLKDDPTDPELPTAVYVNLAHILPSHVDTLLFELLIVGMLRDSTNCTAYHRRRMDSFLVEIPNTPGEETARQLSFCLLLPRTYLQMVPARLDTEVPVLKPTSTNSGKTAMLVNLEKNEQLSRVGKTLHAMNKEMFNPKAPHFKESWVESKEPDEAAERVYALLDDVCCSESSPPSFLVFMNFVKFQGHLVKEAEDWNMMSLAILMRFPNLTHFKHCLYRLLIETSRDFALRQVPKQMLVMGQSPLAPPRHMMNLSRTTSRLSRNMSRIGSTARRISANAAVQRTAAEEESSGVGRLDITTYSERFDQMPSWDKCVHPIACFKKNEHGKTIGCTILSLAKDFLASFIDQALQGALNTNDLALEKDWTCVTYKEAVEQVLYIEGGDAIKRRNQIGGPADYVVTVDNLLKLMSIQQRLRYGLPVILMGETGCGKTSLVKFLAKTLNMRLFTLDVHGGITDEKIIDFLDKALAAAQSDGSAMIFFDEINAANCMALFKSIIIDRAYGNRSIPSSVRIISCCNPYRLRKTDPLAAPSGIVFQHHAGEGATGIRDPMKALVYRVHPLPESLIDVVSDFGALGDASEELYIHAILKKELPMAEDTSDEAAARTEAYKSFITALTKLLCLSQAFVREVHGGERSVVSMRDISRAATVFKWFLEFYSKLEGGEADKAEKAEEQGPVSTLSITEDMKPRLRSAVILTLGYCYHARLQRNSRWAFRQRVAEQWQTVPALQACDWLNLHDKELEAKIVETQHKFVKEMELGEGIALNEALRENLFMLLVSIMNQIPILLVGKPGCSKSLAMEVIRNNLNGPVSKKEFFQSMPAVDVMPYQCSPLSTPDAILNAFQTARFGDVGRKTIVCVLLDEVGLAEESPHLPLKVLHKELEDLNGIACVGISNWELDAAKMNRCVTLYRPPPTIEDLVTTAQGMVTGEGLKGWLKTLSEAFYEIYSNQSRLDFWGMREFYSTVRLINFEIKKQLKNGEVAALGEQVLMKTVQRNFGGMPEDESIFTVFKPSHQGDRTIFSVPDCIDTFFEKCGMDSKLATRYSTKELIVQNLEEPDARHLMLLTKNNAALRLLFDSELLDWSGAKGSKQAEVMFGSTFPGDQSDVFVAMNLQRIKSYMQQPISLVMVHCDSLYESLYDLLNQHYMEYGGQRYVRIAHGSKAKQCPMHNNFRVIVVVEGDDAYDPARLAAPLLNRFEKQIFLRKDLMQEDDALLKRVEKFWQAMQESVKLNAAAERKGISYKPVAGCHSELLSSLVFTLRQKYRNASLDALELEAKRLLTWVMMPEAVCIIASRLSSTDMKAKFGFDLASSYFEEQQHSDLIGFTEAMLTESEFNCDPYGAQVMALTYSPIRSKVGEELQSASGTSSVKTSEVSLHELTSSIDMEKSVKDFYNEAEASRGEKKHIFLIHADPIAASVRMIEHCRFVCERERSNFVSKAKDSEHSKKLEGSASVIMIVHLQRGWDNNFSFDFDSKWHYAFLDSVEPAQDLSDMPSLGKMMNMPLLEVVKGLDFPKLLRLCFRSSLSRLIYPHRRTPEDMYAQIQLILKYTDMKDFTDMACRWMLDVLAKTKKAGSEATVGEDRHWFADIATEAHELALAGTYKKALHNRIVVLIGSLFTTLLAHLDRNGGLELFEDEAKRGLWLDLAKATLSSTLSGRLHTEASSALTENVLVQHEVGTDARTAAKPFKSRLPLSWFINKSLMELRHGIDPLPADEQLKHLQQQYEQLTTLHEIGINPVLGPELLADYLADFTAMYVECTGRIERERQAEMLNSMLTRLNHKPLTSFLEVHQLFWSCEKTISFCLGVLNAVPHAVDPAMKVIQESEPEQVCPRVLLFVYEELYKEVTATKEADVIAKAGTEKDVQASGAANYFCRDWLRRKDVVGKLSLNFHNNFPHADAEVLKQIDMHEPRIETLALFMREVTLRVESIAQRQVYELQRKLADVRSDDKEAIQQGQAEVKKRQDLLVKERVPLKVTQELATELQLGKTRDVATFLAMLRVGEKAAADTGSMQEKFLSSLGSYIESWMLEICLKDDKAISSTNEQCLKLFCGIAAGLQVKIEPHALQGVVVSGLDGWKDKEELGISNLPNKGGSVPRSSSLSLALMRKLLKIANDHSKAVATKEIQARLKEIAAKFGHNDSSSATKYAVLCEEAASEKMAALDDPDNWPDFQLDKMYSEQRLQTPHDLLDDIGHVRWMLAQYAEVLCDPDLTEEDELLERHEKIVKKVDHLLHADPALPVHKVCRSMRIFLLKCMDSVVGSTTVRGALSVPPLSDTTWVMEWRKLHEIDFEKFIGAALVPKWNPFNDERMSKEYVDAKAAVLKCMNSESCQALDAFAEQVRKLSETEQRKHIGALLLACCQEPGLLAALEDEGQMPAWRPRLLEWLQTTKALPIKEEVRILLRVFAGDASVFEKLPEKTRQFLKPFNILKKFNGEAGASMETLLRWRVLGNLAGALIAAPPSSLLAMLRTIMLSPTSLSSWKQGGSKPVFLPGMDEDLRSRVVKALLARGENVWSTRNHWYKCKQCGYSFFIGECGRPMQESKCPNCTALIGGKDHTASADTVQDDDTDRSPPGYVLPLAERDEKHVTFRDLTSSAARLVRVLLHGSMFLGLLGQSSNTQEMLIFDRLVNSDSTCTMKQTIDGQTARETELAYIGGHWNNDWKQLVSLLSTNPEDLAVFMHSIIRKLMDRQHDDPKNGLQGETFKNWEILTMATRNAWEETLDHKCFKDVLSNVPKIVAEAYQEWGKGQEDGKFVAELKERADVNDFAHDKRRDELPQLWASRGMVSMDTLHARIGMERNPVEHYPVLVSIVQAPLYKTLEALGCLVGVFEWHSLVSNHLSGRITKEAAAQQTIGEFIAGLPQEEQATWEIAFSAFAKAWSIAWSEVERYECFTITENYKKVKMTKDTPLIWAILDQQGEGICPLALTQFLIERHNEVAETVRQACGHPVRNVSSRMIAQHDAITFTPADLETFLRTRCVTYGVAGKVNFDLALLEQHLRQHMARPDIVIEVRSFHWLGDAFSFGAELLEVIPQKDLSNEIKERLSGELQSKSLANACLQKVQMSVSFILKSGGALGQRAGDMVLSDYLKTILCESEDALLSQTARREVRLCHVDSFVKLLQGLIGIDPMDGVDPKYRAELPEQLFEELESVKPTLPDSVVGGMAWMAQYLQEVTIGPETKLCDSLLNAPQLADEDADKAIIKEQLEPLELLMKYWVEVYRILAK